MRDARIDAVTSRCHIANEWLDCRATFSWKHQCERRCLRNAKMPILPKAFLVMRDSASLEEGELEEALERVVFKLQ
jgi:hypothetical protein